MTEHVLDVGAVGRAVADVPDPELPPVTLGMLGMVHHLDVADDGTVSVELLPTFSGCPATEMIERDVVEAVRAVPGVEHVKVRFRFDPPWTPDRIDATGRERLREFGIAPPGGPIHGAVAPGGRRSLPLALGATTEKPLGATTDKALGTPTDKVPGTTTDKVPGTTTDEILGTTTDEVLGTTTERVPGTTTEGAPGATTVEAAPRTCPYCASTDTVRDSAFGPTPCRDVRYCNACQQPFEAFKPL